MSRLVGYSISADFTRSIGITNEAMYDNGFKYDEAHGEFTLDADEVLWLAMRYGDRWESFFMGHIFDECHRGRIEQ